MQIRPHRAYRRSLQRTGPTARLAPREGLRAELSARSRHKAGTALCRASPAHHPPVPGFLSQRANNIPRASNRFSSVQSLSHVQLFATPWTSARQASLSITNSRSLFKLMTIESVMPSNHLILCRPLLLPPSIFPSIRVFSLVFLFTWNLLPTGFHVTFFNPVP